jgi:tetratricopeptide (TPR) repeat protein
MEQGRLEEAVAACQKMLDLRPDLHSYARGAHLRWLKGNVEGAGKLMRLASAAASPQDSESAAWVNTRLAGYEFQLGDLAGAERSCALALDLQKDYPPALLLRGRLLLAQENPGAAVEPLQRAAEINPLPDYQWTLAEALQASGRGEEAAVVEAQLRRTAAAADPRTFSLYLATRGESPETAWRLAEVDLESRSDVFTHDALAWSAAACGKLAEARQQMAQALAEGTRDGRLFFHAALIAHRVGDESEAQRFTAMASELKHLLLPCERAQLRRITFPFAESIVTAGGIYDNTTTK